MESVSVASLDATLKGIEFGLATSDEICKASTSECPISHVSQISNPFLGLPLDTGKCESCGTGEPGQCEGHFGYVELPTPIYHPDHVSELKRMLSLVCLKCLKIKNRKVKNIGIMEQVLSACCEETIQVSINEAKTTDGACYLELKMPSRSRREEPWSFLEKYGFRFRHINKPSRPLLAAEVMAMLKKMPQDTRKKLCGKGFFPQDGYILQYLPVPPNCLSVPEVSDGISTMSTDHSIALLKKVLRQVEIIRSSRSGRPNFESQEIEACELQAAVAQYLQFRGTNKASRDVDTRFGVHKELSTSTTKAWLEKMKTLFIRKGSGFSSRSVITGDPYRGVAEIGLPEEIAQKITFEERVNEYNLGYLQKLVDEKRCLTYKDGKSTYSLQEGSKGHTVLRPGQVVHRRIVDGDKVFINRPPTTHKHSLQALSVYTHSDHTVKINPLICGPLGADFDGDCIHLFYPQSLEAKAEVIELFSVEKQLLSSHTGNFNLQLATDALLSLKRMFQRFFLTKEAAQQLAMFALNGLAGPTVSKCSGGALWTAPQILQMALPPSFSYSGERYQISLGEVLSFDYSKEAMSAIVNDIVTSMYFFKGSKEVMEFFDALQPLLMENLFSEGFSISLRDFFVPGYVLENAEESIRNISPLLRRLRSAYTESASLHLENFLSTLKDKFAGYILNSSIGFLIDSRSESALNKVVQQMGFLGLQVSGRGKFYSETLLNDVSTLFHRRYPSSDDHPAEEMGLVSRPLFRGLNPYQVLVHSISSREVMVRSSRGLTEPGSLFKNLMAILRDVVVCYDGTVRNMCSNSILQFEYGVVGEFCAGEPVGVLAATAMSTPAYKAVLDSSYSSWDMMKDILLCRASFKNDVSDRRVLLYLKSCDCGRKHCCENAALVVKNLLTKVIMKDMAVDFLIEYQSQLMNEADENSPGLVGHIHLSKDKLLLAKISAENILAKCQETIILHQKQKKVGKLFKRVDLSHSDCCSFQCGNTSAPCIQFMVQTSGDGLLEKSRQLLVDTVCPTLLQTVIKGDSRVSSADIVWVKNQSQSPKGELTVDVVVEKTAVRKSGDAWRVVLDSCLPVIKLIDTRRSIPHAIKEVEEMLGISCSFELAIQRLSKSVTMVTRGVLKDHILLLGNSMTCTGSLIGFNPSGIKSLSRTLNIQVPFMNATLFTPRKHFERSAQKCHVDNLSSVVASCVWGKHVSLGTGSSFEILLDTRKAELNPEKEIDVYDFLHLVNSSSRVDDRGTSCLGAEVDDLSPDDFMDFDLSPARESGADKPVFEDDAFVLNGNDNAGISSEDAWSGWGKKVNSEDNAWSGWGKKVDSEDNAWNMPTSQTETAPKESSKGWSRSDPSSPPTAQQKEKESLVDNWGWSSKTSEPTASETWGSHDDWNKPKAPSTPKESPADNWTASEKQSDDSKADPVWGSKASSWGAKDADSRPSNAWGSHDDWNKPKAQAPSTPKESPADNWTSTEKQSDDSKADPVWGSKDSSWGAKDADSRPSNAWGSHNDWNKPKAQAPSTPKESPADNWTASEKQSDDSKADPVWGSKASSWGAKDADSRPSNAWGSHDDWNKPKAQAPSTPKESPADNWNASEKQSDDDSKADPVWGSKDGSWGAKDADSRPSNAWGSRDDRNKPKAQAPSTPKESPVDNWTASEKQSGDSEADPVWGSKDGSWGAKDADSRPSNAWGSSSDWDKLGSLDSQVDNSWGSAQKQSSDSTSSRDGQPQWRGRGRGWGRGRGRGRDGSQGRGNSFGGERRNMRPPRPDDGNAPGVFTVTRQRFDVFTAEEQDVLSEVEAVMKNVRRVMKYNDGDPLPEDDQKFVIESLLNYHPDKISKIGAGVDYIMVNKHKEFQESRCFYAVSTDGGEQDFSYRKCLQSFIAQKYPDKAESFISRYFQKLPHQRYGWRNRDSTEGSGTPLWDNQSSASPSWNREDGPTTTEEAATPNL